MSNSPRYYLYKRTNGIYYIGYYEAGHLRWKSTGEHVKANAHSVLANFKRHLQTKSDLVTLSDFNSKFLPFALANYSTSTSDFYRLALNRLVTLVGNLPLSSLTMQHLDQFKVTRMKDGISANTVNRDLQALRAAMYTALRWKLIEQNPFSKIHFVAVPQLPPTYFSKDAVHKLLTSIHDEWLKEILLMAALTGMRRGEILNLQWKDLDMKNRLISIQSSPTFKTKNGKSRVIPMNDLVFSMLTNKRESSELQDYVFTKGGLKIYDDHATKKLKKYIRLTFGKESKLHFHSLRHTFATWLVQGGVNIYDVQKLLGHSSVSVTEVYAHLQPSTLHSTVNKISIQTK